ncbi:MAG: CgeB family protein, partial [Nitrospinaceae bacterium]
VQSFPRLLDYDFKIWGTEWNLDSILGSRVQNNNKRLNSDNIIKIYNAAKINLNLHSSSFHEGVNPVGDFVNPRTFEIAACGGFQLIDDRSELDDLMDPIKEIVTFSSIDDLCEKIDYYLNNSDEAKVIASCGKERVLKEHTIQHRMEEMLIYIFMDNLEQLTTRFKVESRDPVVSSIDYAGLSTDLGKYLEQFRGSNDFSIKTMVDKISISTGDLSKEELLVLMTDQLVKTESNNG